MTLDIDEEQVQARGQYLARTTRLGRYEVRVIAYLEECPSTHAVAGRTVADPVAVEKYLHRYIATFGPAAFYDMAGFDVEQDLEPITRDEFEDLHEHDQGFWLHHARQHPDRAPDWFDGGTPDGYVEEGER